MLPATYILFDLETTANGPNDCPEAYWPDNKVLLCGWQRSINQPHVITYPKISVDDTITEMCDLIKIELDRDVEVHLVAHNIKFDLKYLLRDRPSMPWHR